VSELVFFLTIYSSSSVLSLFRMGINAGSRTDGRREREMGRRERL